MQVLRALERHEEADAALDALLAAWEASEDAATRDLHEVIVDQFRVAGHRVLTYRMLKPREPDMHYVWMFVVPSETGRPRMTVQVESSAYGRDRGVPYLIGLHTSEGHHTLGKGFRSVPPYLELRSIAAGLIAEELGDASK